MVLNLDVNPLRGASFGDDFDRYSHRFGRRILILLQLKLLMCNDFSLFCVMSHHPRSDRRRGQQRDEQQGFDFEKAEQSKSMVVNFLK